MIRDYELPISEQALEFIQNVLDYWSSVPAREREMMYTLDKRWYIDIDTKKYYEDYFPLIKKWNQKFLKDYKRDRLILDIGYTYVSQVLRTNADHWISNGQITAENAAEYADGEDLDYLLTKIKAA